MTFPILTTARARLAICLALFSTAAQAAVTFAPAVNYPVGNQPLYVAAGDFNGDGKPDLAVTNSSSNNVSILLNNGNGTFAAAVNYATGNVPQGIAAGDLDGDGDIDLVVANGSANTVSVLLNNGNGTFAAHVTYASVINPRSVALGDLDGDGDLDIVVSNGTTNDVSILKNNGNGTFAAAVSYATGLNPFGIALGDLDGDGDLDLAVADISSNTVSVLLNNGAGTFAPRVAYPVGAQPFSVAIGDLNGDGRPDLAVANAAAASTALSILLNNGNGTFGAAASYTVGIGPMVNILADVDADGRLDVVAANHAIPSSLSLGLGNGDGTFQAAATLPSLSNPRGMVAVDFNGDGALDLAVVNQHGSANNVSILLAVAAVPGAPTIGTASAGNAQISVAFTAPASNGGSPILDYTATCGSQSVTGAGSPLVVTGLTNGTAYTCTVTARNGVGTSAPSAASNSATPATIPGAPVIGTATGGNAQISVAFTPGADGGSTILDYTATCGTQSATGAASPLVVTGLTNGTAYTCTVVARNAVGTGPASAPSNSVTPATIPGAPVIGTAIAGNTQISVAFTVPASNGGAAVLDYTATCGGQSATAASSPITVSGLVNGTAYTCTVVARNAVGTGPASAASNSATPVSVPFAPTGVVATAGNAQISVAFTPGGSGGSPILDFTATCGTQSMAGVASPLVVTGLVNGTAYTCTVVARNAVGTSAPSTASSSATPTVNTYSGPSATGTGTITASFSGGGPTCTYTVSRFIPLTGDPASPPAGTAPIGTTFPHGLFDFTTSGCTPGSTITMTITYPTALLTGTQYWKYGPTPGNTTPHWYVLPATITSNTVTFTITDGALGDDDLTANGTIVDQGGPGVPGSATAVPTLSEWALIALAILVGWLGLRRIRPA